MQIFYKASPPLELRLSICNHPGDLRLFFYKFMVVLIGRESPTELTL